jgi:hypothetical protein
LPLIASLSLVRNSGLNMGLPLGRPVAVWLALHHNAALQAIPGAGTGDNRIGPKRVKGQ